MNDAGVRHCADTPVLELRSVSKSFGALRVLSDISLKVARGDTVCIVGPSGSGKSTLLRCINWLEKPDIGAVYLSGQRVGVAGEGHVAMSDKDPARIRTRIGTVFQHFALWPHLTVLQNVMEAPLYVQKRPRAEVRETAEALLDKVGLRDKRDAATRMVFIDRGQIVETGSPAQFLSAPSTERARQFLQRYASTNATAIAAGANQVQSHDRAERVFQ